MRKIVFDAAGNWDRSPANPTITINTAQVTQPLFGAVPQIAIWGGSPVLFLAFDNWSSGRCTSATGRDPIDISWFLTWSTDGGANWQAAPAAQPIKRDQFWPRCIAQGQLLGNAYALNGSASKRAQFVIDQSTGHCLIALSLSDRAVATDLDYGTRLHVYRSLDGVLWTDVEAPPPSQAMILQDQWSPSLAFVQKAGTTSRALALTWHDTRDDPTPGTNRYVSMWAVVSTNDGDTWTTPTRISALGGGVPWDSRTGSSRDYEFITGNPITMDILAVWGGDTRAPDASCLPGGVSPDDCNRVYTSVLTP